MTTFGRLESISKPRATLSAVPGCSARLDASLHRSLASEEQMDALVRDHALHGDGLRGEHITRWGFDPAICAWIRGLGTASAVEIGSGAGRWSVLFRGDLLCVDGVSVCFDSIRRLRQAHGYARTHFCVQSDGCIDPGRMAGCSVAFSFDTFVHMDQWLVENYLCSVTRMSNIRKCGFHLWTTEPSEPWARSNAWALGWMRDRGWQDSLVVNYWVGGFYEFTR